MQWVRNLTLNQEVPGLIPIVTMVGSVDPSDQYVVSSKFPVAFGSNRKLN